MEKYQKNDSKKIEISENDQSLYSTIKYSVFPSYSISSPIQQTYIHIINIKNSRREETR